MEKEDFHTILAKYLRGEASDEERKIIDGWYNNMGNVDNSFSESAEELEMGNRYWAHIRKHIDHSGKRISWLWYSLGLAASALLMIVAYLNMGFGTATPVYSDNTDNTIDRFERVANRTERPEVVMLPDGSKATLEPQSRLRYEPGFAADERRVFLKGKAFFEVVEDTRRPFKVYTEKVITEVLGTSFVVDAFPWNQEVMVSVKTGKVSVYTKEDAQEETQGSEVILTPNQRFVYHKEQQRSLKTIVEKPRALIPVEEVKRMRFEETSPNEVFRAIEKVYGVDIVYDEDKFSGCRITTSISDGNIFNRIHIICEVINATWWLDGEKIRIEGVGCYSAL